MEIKETRWKIRFIDSLNFIARSLAAMPSMFGLEDEVRKGFFPHFFNKPENMDFCGYLGELPKSMFGYDGMSETVRTEFELWYSLNANQPFVLAEELEAYCKNDVYVLRKCCLQYREKFMQASSNNGALKPIDPFQYITLASACMADFRCNHLTDESIPIHYPRTPRTHSKSSILWMEYLSKTEGKNIQHAMKGGEKRIEGIGFVDGYCDKSNEIFEFLGCYFHGCNRCFKSDTINTKLEKSMGELWDETEKRLLEASNAYNVRSIRECEFQSLYRTDPFFKTFELDFEYIEPLQPRDAFYGGRTDSCKLYYAAKPLERINYYDFTSLYPSVMVNKYFPSFCHPQVIHGCDISDHSDVSMYFGFIKCKVVPPKGLYHPVLPVHINKKLMFVLCEKCALLEHPTCNHSEEERSVVGTWVTEEVKKAQEKGYKVVKIYEVWHFEKKSMDLFKGYICKYLKIKQECSGFPEGVDTLEDKQLYVDEYFQNQGVQLNIDSIHTNKGMREVAKLFLNSLWGKFGQRDEFSQTAIININTIHMGFTKLFLMIIMKK